jgi:magnesium transporter
MTDATALAADSEESRHLLTGAAAHATRSIPLARPDETAATARRNLLAGRYEFAADVAVLDGERFAGLLPLERLLAAGDAERIDELMDADAPRVAPGTDQEIAAWTMVRHGESSLAVVGADGSFTGLIPPVRMLGVLLSEHDEDLARLGGLMVGTRRARDAAEEPVPQRVMHRMPWLLLGLAGALIAAAIVGSFEEEIRSQVLLASFLPGVVYLADAVGTQTEAIVIRGLSAGVRVPQIAVREMLSGVLVGLAIAAAFVPLAWLIWGDGEVAVGVGLGLLAACSIATVVAMELPWLFQRLGVDPAFGSGPLATVIQDLLSILVYFLIAVPIAT